MRKAAVMICAAGIACTMSFTAFAAETRKEYKAESAGVMEELKSTADRIKGIQDENQALSESCKAVRQSQKDGGLLKENKETWKKVNDLKDDITKIRVSYLESGNQSRLLKAQAREDLESGNYDAAQNKLDQALKEKKEALSDLEKMNEVWEQIDQLLK